MEFIFVINPAAGKRDPSAPLIREIRRAFEGISHRPVIHLTTGTGDAALFCSQYCASHPQEELVFFACGGDGTLEEMVTGLDGFPNAALGVIPKGSGNDFVRNFPGLGFSCVEAQLSGHTSVVDLIEVNGSLAVNLCNAGLDANVARDKEYFKRLPLVSGSGAYLLSILRNLIRIEGISASLSIDGGEPEHLELMLLVLGSGGYYGGGFHGLPKARPDDGLLDLCMVPILDRRTIFRLLPCYQKGKHLEDPALTKLIRYQQCRQIKAEFSQPVTFCMDGETCLVSHLEAKILPGHLRFWLPASVNGTQH